MHKKSQKARAKYKRRSSQKLSVPRETIRQESALPLQFRNTIVAELPTTIEGQVNRLCHVPQELRRIAFTGGIVLVVLIILYILLR